MKIALKLMTGFLIVVLCIVALTYYAVSTGQHSLRESVGKSSIFLAEAMLEKMDQNIFTLTETLKRSTTAVLVEKTLLESNREFARFNNTPEYLEKTEKKWAEAPKNEIIPFMQALLDNALSDSLRAQFVKFYVKRRGTVVFPEILITNKYGAVVALTEKTAGYRQDHQKWWQAARDKDLFVGDVAYNEMVRANVIPLGIRVDDQDGNFIGVMKVLVASQEIIRSAVASTKKFDTTQIKLLTKSGRMIYSSKAFRLFEDVSGKDFFKQIQDSSGFFISKENSKKWLFSYVRSDGYKGFEGLGWILLVGHETGEVFKAVFDLRNNLMIAAVILITAVLVIAFLLSRAITHPIILLTKGADIVSRGDLGHKIVQKGNDEIGRLTASFNRLVENLRTTAAQRELDNWLKTGRSGLDDRLRGDQPMDMICQNILTFVADYLKAFVGALYVCTDKGDYQFEAGYAHKTSGKVSNIFKIGEGLIGQVASDKKPMVINNVPDDYLTVSSGLGRKKPTSIVVVPCLYNQSVVAVMEVGKFDEFNEQHLLFLKDISESIAIAISSVQARMQLQKTLETSQQQAEELQAQQEELRAANEELEEQTQKLQASEEELNNQQEELQVTNEELEEKTHNLEEQREMISLRNRELKDIQKNLEQKARELTITSRYKSEFLANMSHELRTPLNSLLILAQDLTANKKKNLDKEQVESAQIIYNGGQDLLHLINEILDLAKIEAGRMDLNVDQVDLIELSDSIMANCRPLAGQKGLKLSSHIGRRLPGSILADSQRLEQIIRNLVSNAVKFTEKGSVTISYDRTAGDIDLSRSGQDPAKSVAITVTDTGIGISEEKKQVIFEAFQQADGTTSRLYGGTGLGLSISRELARLMGGEIQMNSEMGAGSTFILYIPEAASPTEAMAAIPGVAEKAETATTMTMPEKMPALGVQPTLNDDRDNITDSDRVILVVEDDLNFAKILYRFCQERNFKCIHAGDGETGMALIEEHKPDAIILDIRLPGMMGWDVLEKLKSNAKTRHIPVHMMSVEEASLDAYKKGVMGYLTKPVASEKLAEAFNRIENFISNNCKKLLLVEDDKILRKSIVTLIGSGDVKTTAVATGKDALEELTRKTYDCVILDLKLPDMSGFEVLNQLDELKDVKVPPVIIYTGKDLTRDEEYRLRKYASSIIVKGVKSQERLLDETALFLHRIVENLPKKKRQMISRLYEGDGLFEGKKILLADDDMRNIFAIAKVLEDRGMDVHKAADGQKALDILDKEPGMDLVLMDIMMPVMDGYEAMGRIRSQARFKNLPVIAITAKAMKTDRDKCISAGASDYIAKPVDINRLVSLMRVWLYK
jgi:CheY-like chemotaxis protein/HAMP domain-containing protein